MFIYLSSCTGLPSLRYRFFFVGFVAGLDNYIAEADAMDDDASRRMLVDVGDEHGNPDGAFELEHIQYGRHIRLTLPLSRVPLQLIISSHL